jgi:type III pantothenate kinase
MEICVDVGNSAIKFGVYVDDQISDLFSVDADRMRSSYQYSAIIESLLKGNKAIDGAIISSVVPNLTEVLRSALKRSFSCRVLILDKNLKTHIPIKIDNPNELGADLLAGAVGAEKKYGHPVVIADLGTATKMYLLNKEGHYIGGMITSGMASSLASLVKDTSLLMEVPLEAPKSCIGRNTKDSIQSGIIYGQAYMISEFARRFEKELSYPIKRVITGGFSEQVKDQIPCFNYEPNLVLDGLYEIYKMNIGNKYEK